MFEDINGSKIIILIGNIGSGKTTISKKLMKDKYVIISRDNLRYGIGNGDYIFNKEYEPIILDTAFYMFTQFINLDCNIIIDETNMKAEWRKNYIDYTKDYGGYNIIAIKTKKLSMKECVDNRMKDPHGQFDRKLWEDVWTNFNDIYDEPTKKEGFDLIVQL